MPVNDYLCLSSILSAKDRFYCTLLILFGMCSVLPSQLEKRFITTSMYKRSRNYLDICKLNYLQMKQEQSRRKPYLETTFTEGIQDKFQESFVSAQARLNSRLQTEFEKHQRRFFHDDGEETEASCTFEGRKGKTLDMSKMLSRDYFERDSSECRTQDHFCNFQPYRPPSNHKVDFKKFYIPKAPKKQQPLQNCTRCRAKMKSAADVANPNQSINPNPNANPNPTHSDSLPISTTVQLNADITGKIHEKLIFDESLFKTTVDYKKYNRERSERSSSPSPEKNYERIAVGEEMTRVQRKKAGQEFYHGMNKWNSAQMDNRLMKQNEFFLKMYNQKSEKAVDWSIIKRKSDLVDKRKREIMMRKQIKDVKGQICDELYFRRNHF